MSLLYDNFENFHYINKAYTDDNEGGQIIDYSVGIVFKGIMRKDSEKETSEAGHSTSQAVYTLTTCKGINLTYNSIVKRVSDNTYFRITSESADSCTPIQAGLDMEQVTAEILEDVSND